MKAWTRIDFIAQTIVLILTAIVIVPMIFAGDYIPPTLRFAGIFFGPWQMLSATIGLIAKLPVMKLRLVHIGISISYIGIYMLDLIGGDSFEYGVPALLALGYYMITLNAMRSFKSS